MLKRFCVTYREEFSTFVIMDSNSNSDEVIEKASAEGIWRTVGELHPEFFDVTDAATGFPLT